MKRQLMINPQLLPGEDGTHSLHVGFMYKDAPLFHTIARAKQGQRFEVSSHFVSCEVCKDHGFTEEDFDTQWQALLEEHKRMN